MKGKKRERRTAKNPSKQVASILYRSAEEIGSLDDLLFSQLKEVFKSFPLSKKALGKIVDCHTEVDLASVVSRFPVLRSLDVYNALSSPSSKALFVQHLSFFHQEALFDGLSGEECRKLTEAIPPHYLLSLTNSFSEGLSETIFSSINLKTMQIIKRIEQYPEATAGRLMTANFFTFSSQDYIEEVLLHLKNCFQDDLPYIFVLNGKKELQGVVPLSTLMSCSSHSHQSIQSLMSPLPRTISATTPYHDILAIIRRYSISFLPVVDDKQHLIGVITQSHIMTLFNDILHEVLINVGGIQEETSMKNSVISQCISRSPWLLVTALVGIVNSLFNSSLSESLHDLLSFIPLILGMSGTVGIQCSSIMLRGMTTGALTKRNFLFSFSKEMMSGGVIGVLFGVVIAVFVLYFDHLGVYTFHENALHVASVVGLSLFGACINATLLGIGAPLFFSKIGIDPAVAAGPIVSTLNDMFSLFIVLITTQVLLSLLF